MLTLHFTSVPAEAAEALERYRMAGTTPPGALPADDVPALEADASGSAAPL
jgi:hypothetical protein